MPKSLGVPPLPSRLLSFIIVSDCIFICCVLWQIWRIERRRVQASAIGDVTRPNSKLRDLLKSLAVFAIFESSVFGVISLVFRISPNKLWFPFLLFFIPPLVALPLIFHASQYRDRPKSYAYRMAVAVFAFITLEGISMFYSGLLNWMIPGATSVWGLIFSIAFGATVASVSAFYTAYKRLIATKT